MFTRRALVSTALLSPLAAQAQSLINVPGPLGERFLGNETAPITVIEYASLTCGHCAVFHETTYPELKKKYIETGKVKFIFREFALDPLAAAGFMLARCAPTDQYFAIIEVFFKTQATWARSNDPVNALMNIAKQVGFTKETFEACLTNQKILDGVNAVKAQGEKLGVDATPTLFVNGKKLSGGQSLAELEKQFEPLLK
jgi:protein-disulfide isomerase